MPMDLEKLAKKIAAQVHSAGSVRIWGVDLSPPGDIVYSLGSASVVGEGTLKVFLRLAPGDVSPTIELDAPTGVSVAGGSLTVKSASAVRLNGKEKKQTPEAVNSPALFVGD